jgi:YHS domain-containing protein
MKQIIVWSIIVWSFGLTLRAQDSDGLRLKHYNLKNGIALSGYDPVSYYSSKPVKGKKDLALKYKSVVYLFSTQTNLDKFKTDPTRYEPAYGGWCAYAMGERGEKVEIDPETYKIIHGKVYLYYNTFFNNTLTDWNKDETTLKKKADSNWTTLTK